jgi:hypothetical protein
MIETIGYVVAGMALPLIGVICGYDWGRTVGYKKGQDSRDLLLKMRDEKIGKLESELKKAKEEHYLTD